MSIWRRGNPDLSGSIEIGSSVNIFGMVRMVVTDTNECANSFIKIKDNAYINHGCFLSGEGGLYIGEKVLDVLKNKTNIVNIDITELNLALGTEKEINKSAQNTIELFKNFLN